MGIIKNRVPTFVVGLLLGLLLVSFLLRERLRMGSATSVSPGVQTAQNLVAQRPLPQLKVMDDQILAANEQIIVELELAMGWKLNHEAPSWLSLYRINTQGEEELRTFVANQLEAKRVVLGTLDANQKYHLRGTFYYCQDGKNAQCTLESRDIKIETVAGSKIKDIVIPVGN